MKSGCLKTEAVEGVVVMTIREEVQRQEEYIVSMRRDFHAHPEASLREFETALRIEQELDEMDVPHERVGETGVLGYLGKKDGKTIAMRADTDALEISEKNDTDYVSRNPGLMHACGHDGHMAALLGAVRVLKDREDELEGKVKLLFQQAEEIGQGARQFVSAGHLADVEHVLGIHVSSGLPTGTITVTPGPVGASCDYFRARIVGKSSHVGKPHMGIDALYIASLCVVNLQGIVARKTNPVDPVVVGIGVMNSGTRYNIIAGEAVLEGTFRTFSLETRDRTQESIEKVLRSTCEAYGAQLEIEFRSYSSPVINDKEAAEFTAEIARAVVGEENVRTDQEKSLGADDFAELQLAVPGVYVNVGTWNPLDEGTDYPHHHERFDLDEKGLLVAAELYVRFALTSLRK